MLSVGGANLPRSECTPHRSHHSNLRPLDESEEKRQGSQREETDETISWTKIRRTTIWQLITISPRVNVRLRASADTMRVVARRMRTGGRISLTARFYARTPPNPSPWERSSITLKNSK